MGKPKGSKPARPARELKPQDPMCVFAFRLSESARERIHQAAQKVTGRRGGASQFVVESVAKAVEKVLGS